MTRSFCERTGRQASRPDLSIECKSQGCREAQQRAAIGRFPGQQNDLCHQTLGNGAPTAKAMFVLPMPPGRAVSRTAHIEAWRLNSLTTVSRPIIMIGRHGEPTLGGELGVPVFRANGERDDVPTKRVARTLMFAMYRLPNWPSQSAFGSRPRGPEGSPLDGTSDQTGS